MNIKLLDFKILKDFPSGSGIEFFDDLLYVVGDDAKDILVMNKRWKKKGVINLFPADNNYRIPKSMKADFEATAIIQINKNPFLLILGSGSIEATRNKGLIVDLTSRLSEEIDLSVFYTRLKQSGLKELNIEAAAVMNDKIILCNRGNKLSQDNRIIITSSDFWKKQHDAEIIFVKIEWEKTPENFMALSGLAYSYKNDWLIITASTEETKNAIDDGLIGDSYLGIIENASRKIGRKRIKLNTAMNLTQVDKLFKGHKIESVCMQADNERKLKLHLVADNDNGESSLFKIRLSE
ncbi:MAG: hypothetical protein WKF97_12170 [Chitinophagaceae bacterium]